MSNNKEALSKLLRYFSLTLVIAFGFITIVATGGGGGGGSDNTAPPAPPDLPDPVVAFLAAELLGRPTNDSMTINIVADMAIEAYFEYGTETGVYTAQTTSTEYPAYVPIEVVMNGLTANTRYYYRMVYREIGDTDWITRDEHSFHTQRASGSTFKFTVIADSHLGSSFFANADLYIQTLTNIAADNPDFSIDLGDTFVMEEGSQGNDMTVASARAVYLEQREYMGIISPSVPIFLVIGNHENEEGWNLDDKADPADSLPVLSSNARKWYFLNPVPDTFYSGNTDDDCEYCQYIDGDHLRESYYAWEWGDALFVTLDPFWNTRHKPYAGSLGGEADDETPLGDSWDWTLGETQYLWLKQTLENSTATYKFVFIHHVAGDGQTDIDTNYGRGGEDASSYFEWGGNNADGSWGWDSERAGWDAPIHQLLVDNDVTILFHGHDHVYAKEEVDGVVYQECPRPDDGGYSTGFDYYDPEIMVANSGHIYVTVSPTEVLVEYIRAYLPGDGPNGEVAATYTITPP